MGEHITYLGRVTSCSLSAICYAKGKPFRVELRMRQTTASNR
jgi:hypothetical protein